MGPLTDHADHTSQKSVAQCTDVKPPPLLALLSAGGALAFALYEAIWSRPRSLAVTNVCCAALKPRVVLAPLPAGGALAFALCEAIWSRPRPLAVTNACCAGVKLRAVLALLLAPDCPGADAESPSWTEPAVRWPAAALLERYGSLHLLNFLSRGSLGQQQLLHLLHNSVRDLDFQQ